jgi:hypothetical protein
MYIQTWNATPEKISWAGNVLLRNRGNFPKYVDAWTTCQKHICKMMCEDMDKVLEKANSFCQKHCFLWEKSSRNLEGFSVQEERAQWNEKNHGRR